ncbi:MAG: leucyl aminopeptidase [candidate division Zixibacteria bacterium CG_4_9_14_3_um_filter_46_8]|nr:MAG: leucyl aminopeptidase [candidate division Zixibacteria bacterium CG_4_9_14_3_um_filter_46_8]
MTKLEKAALTAVRDCMFAKNGESILIVMDEPEKKIGYALFEAAKSLGCEAMVIEMLPREANGQEPPPQIANLMKQFDAVLVPTSKSLSHTKARRVASGSGVRIATLPGILEATMVRALNADYQRIAALSIKLCKILSEGQTARVTAPAGTDITMSLKGRVGKPDTGLVKTADDFSNLPAGEAYIAPVEGSGEGIIVVDGSMAGIGILQKPLSIMMEKGYATGISGGAAAIKLKKMLDSAGMQARNLAELGIGTNYKAKLCGSVLEDEKVLGTVHLALGDNKSMGGKVSVPSHLDGIILKPTLYIDDVCIIKSGKMLQ